MHRRLHALKRQPDFRLGRQQQQPTQFVTHRTLQQAYQGSEYRSGIPDVIGIDGDGVAVVGGQIPIKVGRIDGASIIAIIRGGELAASATQIASPYLVVVRRRTPPLFAVVRPQDHAQRHVVHRAIVGAFHQIHEAPPIGTRGRAPFHSGEVGGQGGALDRIQLRRLRDAATTTMAHPRRRRRRSRSPRILLPLLLLRRGGAAIVVPPDARRRRIRPPLRRGASGGASSAAASRRARRGGGGGGLSPPPPHTAALEDRRDSRGLLEDGPVRVIGIVRAHGRRRFPHPRGPE